MPRPLDVCIVRSAVNVENSYTCQQASRLTAHLLYRTRELVCDLNLTEEQLNAGRTFLSLVCLTKTSALSASLRHPSLLEIR